MSTVTTAHRFRSRLVVRFINAVVATASVAAGLPVLLVAAADARFGHASPLHGMNAPWRWTGADVRSWGRRLTRGLDSSAELVDLFLRIALVIGWICVAILVYTVVDEVVFQLRHGMPSAHRRRMVGLGPLGRKLASALVAVLPLIASSTPTLAARPIARPVAALVVPDGVTAHAVDPPSAPLAAPPAGDAVSGWSLVEVRRGDSVWAIAERIADGRDVAAIARQIVGANLGNVMNDGHRFSTPALIEPGWVLSVPMAATAVVAESSGDAYVVVRGDSYWKIADELLDPSATPQDIARYTSQLIELNAPRLDYVDPRLIRPGDVLQLPPAEAEIPATPTPAVAEVPAEPGQPTVSPDSSEPPVAVAAPTTTPLPPPTTFPPPSSQPVQVGDPVAAPPISNRSAVDDGIPVKRGLGAAVLLAGGTLGVLEARRRRQLRSARIGARLPLPPAPVIETERQLRSSSQADLLARLDLALRSVARALSRQQARVVAAEVADDGEIRVYADRPAFEPASRWLLDVEAGAWRLPDSVTLVELADDARGVNQPCPAIVHIGQSAGGQLFVDLESVGVLSVEAPRDVAASIVRCVTASLAVSPFLEAGRVFTVGLPGDSDFGNPAIEPCGALDQAVTALRDTVGSVAIATSGSVTTFALRANSTGGEAWEPSLLLAVGGEPDGFDALVSLAGGGGRGVGVMIDRPIVGSGAVLRATEGDFVLEPLGRRVTPVGLSLEEVAAVGTLLGSADVAVPVDGDVPTPPPVSSPMPFDEYSDLAHEFVVRVLGQVQVRSASGVPVAFDRSKAQELVVWLSQHRQHPTRAAARTALWELAVRDATFSNVVSDARRALARAVPPPSGQEWIGRTMNEDLPLHHLVVSDADLLGRRVEAARGLGDLAAIDVLRPGVASIAGIPFEGTSYLWPDAEGITSSLVLLATSAAGELAERYLAVGDVDGVFWATGQGLKVLAGHEALIALRMRAHADRGDLAGVRSEWESYERAVQADSWSAAEPSPKLVELRHRLLSPPLAS